MLWWSELRNQDGGMGVVSNLLAVITQEQEVQNAEVRPEFGRYEEHYFIEEIIKHAFSSKC